MMKNLISRVFSGLSLMTVVLLAACGTNNCPSGQTMMNNVCTNAQGVNGQCGVGQLQSQYGCLQTNINGCSGNMGWSPQVNSCVPGTPVQQTGFNGQFPQQNYPGQPVYNGFPQNNQNGCQNGYIPTRAYGCLPSNNCPYLMGYGPFGCTY